MPVGQLEHFACEGCGKSYRWKAELAGKRVKCKCGHTMTVPHPPEPAAESDDPFADALSAMDDVERSATIEADLPRCPSCASEMSHGSVLCTQCGFNVNTGKVAGVKKGKAAQPVGMGVGGADGGGFSVAPAAARAVAAAPKAGTLAYAGMPVGRALNARAAANAGDNNIGHTFKDLVLPIILFLVGVAVLFCDARYGQHVRDVGTAMLFVGFTVVINLALVFAGIMIAVRLLSLGLGPIGPAMLKIAAVAILPGAVGNLLFDAIGLGGYFIVWLVSLGLTYALFMGLLGLDFQETGICSCIIWVVRTWIGYGIVMALLGGLGRTMAAPGSRAGGAIAAMSNPSSGGLQKPKPPKHKSTAAELDAKSQAALAQPGAIEAIDWVKGATPDEGREINRLRDIPNLMAIEELYKGGAKHVIITRTKTYPEPTRTIVRQLVLVLPTAKEDRVESFSWAYGITRSFTGSTQPDRGQKYLLVDFDEPPTDDEADDVDESAGQ